MDFKNSPTKRYILIITYGILLFLGLSNLDKVFKVGKNIFSIFYPIVLGICIAFVLNLLLKLLEEKAFKKVFLKFPKVAKFKRPICIVLTFIIVIALFTGLIMFIVPQLYQSIKLLGASVPGYIEEVNIYLNKIAQEYNFTSDLWQKISENWKEIINTMSNFVTTALPYLLNITMGITSGVFNFVLGVTLSIYLLYSKEKLILMLKKLNYAFIKKEYAEKVEEISHNINVTFSKFIGGQLTEALILGSLCFVGMSIFRMPYAILISVIVAVTALIPILGAYIGTIPSAFIIFMESPIMALGFIIFIICLQQFEGSVIYPKVVGKSIGLSGLWVLSAITVGGSLFGLTGMLLGVPIFAVIYLIVRKITYARLQEKNITIK